MRDAHYILIFTGIGLITAFAVSKPLRQPAELAPRVGTPLRPMTEQAPTNVQVYAEGTISLGEGLSAKSEARALFIIARPIVNGAPTGGPPIAVKKMDASTLPVTFSLTTADNMVGEDFYDGDIVVLARIDADGMAGPKQPQDIEASAQVKKGGSRQVDILLSQ